MEQLGKDKNNMNKRRKMKMKNLMEIKFPQKNLINKKENNKLRNINKEQRNRNKKKKLMRL